MAGDFGGHKGNVSSLGVGRDSASIRRLEQIGPLPLLVVDESFRSNLGGILYSPTPCRCVVDYN